MKLNKKEKYDEKSRLQKKLWPDFFDINIIKEENGEEEKIKFSSREKMNVKKRTKKLTTTSFYWLT